jgi:carboxypeptidase family protein/TonB-dependent receptor-like protein
MRRSTSFVVLVILLSASAIPSWSQKITGDISGTVQDSTGAIVKDAKISATNTATGETRSATSSDAGFYRIVQLQPGTYKVTATAPGFKTSTRDAEVGLSLVTQSDFQLQLGQVSEVVEVGDVAPLVETTEDRLSTLIDSRRVEDLPNNGRDFNNLLDGVPGVQRSPGGGFQSLNINGQRATSNNFAIDGIPNNDRYYGESALGQAAIAGTAAALIALEGISEFNVQSNPGVEYGVRGGSVINIGLRSGTNDLHGSAFWDRHTDAFDARNWFASEVTPFRLNQYGGSVGFPIIKNKTFAFVSFQAFHLKDVFPSLIDVPTSAEVFDATQCVETGVNPDTAGSGLPCLNNGPGPGSDQIFGTADDGTVNSIGANLVSFLPTSPTGQLNVQAQNKLDLTGFHFKVDHIFNPSHRVSVKYVFSDSLGNQPAAPGVPQSVGPLATNSNMWNSVAPSRAQLLGLNYTWTINPTMVLESRLGYTRFSQRIGINNNIDPNALGLNTGPLGAGPDDKENFGVPAVYYLGYFGNTSYSVLGGVQGYPIITQPDATYDWQEHFTAIKGNHTIKIGGQFQNAYTKSRRDRSRSDLSFYYYGFYNCAAASLCDPIFGAVDEKGNPVVSQSSHVAALNELLLGLTEGSGRSFGVTNRRIFQKSLGLYVQDTWKVKPNFTVELGVRWDMAGALGEDKNLGANFLPDDPRADADGFVSLTKEPLYGVDKNNFGPRIGFAWDVFSTGKTVLRGGYSLNYDLPNFATIHAPQTFLNAFSGTRAGFYTQVAEGDFPIQIFSTPASNQAIFDSGTQPNSLCTIFICMASGVNIYGQSVNPAPPFNVVQVLRNFQTPKNHAFNVTLEQELGNRTSFSIAYVGTRGDDLVSWRDLNACPISVDPCRDPDFPNRQPFHDRFPQYNHILRMTNDAYSNYNSLQTAFKVRNLHGLTGQLNFVWSRSFDTGSANRGGDFLTQFQNPYNIDANYAPASFDTPWNVNFTLVYDIPTVQSVPKLIGEGWSINSIFRAQPGRPFTPFIRGDPSNQGLRSTFANYDGSSLNYDFHNPDQFLNVDAFSAPDQGTVGNAGRNSLRQPGISQWDMSVFKAFKFGERFSVRFSWEVFNILNHGMFATETGNINSSSFGTFFATPDVGIGFNPVLGTGAQRNMQFGLKVAF